MTRLLAFAHGSVLRRRPLSLARLAVVVLADRMTAVRLLEHKARRLLHMTIRDGLLHLRSHVQQRMVLAAHQ